MWIQFIRKGLLSELEHLIARWINWRTLDTDSKIHLCFTHLCHNKIFEISPLTKYRKVIINN